MKLLKLTLLGLALVGLVSCKNDDDSAKNPSALSGTWNLSGFVYTKTNTTTTNKGTTIRLISGEAINLDMRYIFSDNPKETSKEGRFDVLINTTFEGETTTQTSNSNTISTGISNGGNYALSNSQLTVNYANGTQALFTVETLSESTMILTTSEEITVEQNEQTIASNSESTITLSR